jgi:hypothetical protein
VGLQTTGQPILPGSAIECFGCFRITGPATLVKGCGGPCFLCVSLELIVAAGSVDSTLHLNTASHHIPTQTRLVSSNALEAHLGFGAKIERLDPEGDFVPVSESVCARERGKELHTAGAGAHGTGGTRMTRPGCDERPIAPLCSQCPPQARAQTRKALTVDVACLPARHHHCGRRSPPRPRARAAACASATTWSSPGGLR